MFKGNFDINLDFLKLKSPPLIGVDISSSSVKMIGNDNQAYRIERYVIESLPADAMQDGGIANMEA
jgi:type IV pilus assembly protein PilM